MRIQNRLPCTKSKAGQIWLGILNSTPCLARVQREQKATAKTARFGVHLTKMCGFSELAESLGKGWYFTSLGAVAGLGSAVATSIIQKCGMA
jgi:hypothetical protein